MIINKEVDLYALSQEMEAADITLDGNLIIYDVPGARLLAVHLPDGSLAELPDAAIVVVDAHVPPVPEIDTARQDVMSAADNTLAALDAFIAIGPTPTNVQVRDQVIVSAKILRKIIRYLKADLG